MVNIRVIDETTAGTRTEAPMLELECTELTVRDLISQRVRAEVRRYNVDRPDVFRGLIQPSAAEQMINGSSRRPFKPVDADHQVDVAIQAFKEQGFLILLPSGQVQDLDAPVRLSDGDEVSFLRLVPLIGG